MKLFYTLLIIIYAGLFSGLTAQNISFYADNSNGCAPLIVNFTNTSSIDTSGVTFYWNFGDGSNNVSGYNSTHIFMNVGNYYVSLDAFDGPNYLGSYNYNINVNGASSSFYMSTGTQACPGENIQFGTNDFTYWTKWFTSDGDSSEGNWFSHTFANPGIYTITLVENTSCGTDTIIQTLNVSNSAVSSVQIGMNGGYSFCPGEFVSLFDINPASSYLWDFGDGTFSVASEPQHQFSPEGDYQVILHATNICGNTSIDSAWVHVEDSMPVFAYINSWPNDVCPGENINFSSGNIGQYLWSFGDGTTSTAAYPYHIYADTGNYNVSLIITNACGSSDTAYTTMNISYHPTNPPNAQIEFENFENWSNGHQIDTLIFCSNTLVMFRNNSWTNNGSSSNYFWDFGDGSFSTQMNASHTFTQTGMHSVKMIISNNCGASDTAYKWIIVDPNILPDAQLQILPTNICPGETVYFFDDNFKDEEGGNSYSIWFGDGTSQLNITQNTDSVLHVLSSHLFATAGSYNYIFTVTNSCGNTDTLSGTIVVGSTSTPFYYITNSTSSDNNGPDWSIPQSATDQQFYIPVHFPQWVSGMNNKFFIVFWYGSVDLNGDPGEPSGIMTMTGLGTAHAYVPVQSDSVTIVGAWSCDGQLGGGNGNGPDAYDLLGVFPLVQNGVTNIPEPGIQIAGWDGTCDTAQVPNPYAACPGDNVDFMVVGGLTYEWHFGDGTTSTLQNPIHAYTLAGTYDATCIVTNGCNALTTLHTEVVVSTDNTPNSNFYTNNYSSCSGTPIYFNYQQNNGNSDSYSFLWNFDDGTTSVERDPVHTFMQGGEYNILLTVSNGCGSSTTSNIYSFGPEVHSIISDGCAGADNGFIDLTINSNSNTSVQWSNGSSGEDIFNLSPGNYTVTVTTDNNCQLISTYTINPVSTLNAMSVSNSISCAGMDDGEISIVTSGGVSPYIYLWSTGDDSPIVSDLPAGSYTITVVDAGGCSDIISEDINEPSLLIAFSLGTDVLCNGASTGQAIETVLGGTQPYLYVWSDLQTTATASNLAAGTYYVTIIDAHACEVIDSVFISQPTAYNFNFNVTQSTCGINNGSIALTVTGGTPSYTYLWSDAGANTTSTVTALSSGIYLITVSDNNSCDTVLAVALNDNNAPSLTSSVNDVLCFNQSNGSIYVVTTGGTQPYTYNWSNSSSNDSISNLTAGAYYVTVSDGASCHVYGVYTVEEPALLVLNTTQINLSCFQVCNGTAVVVPSGGTAPYSYDWVGGNTNTATNLCAGLQNITVTDSHNCNQTTNITLTQPTQIMINLTGYNVQCFGGNNGYITSSVTGGTGSYDFIWSDGDTLQNNTGLASGSYTVTVTDANSCTNLAAVTISQPAVIANSFLATNATSATATDGSIDLTVTGGIQPYTYTWNNAAITEDISALLTGNYFVTVTDANGCNLTDTIFVNFTSSINGLLSASSVKIYPNPSSGTLFIENAENTSVEILNILGNVVFTVKKASYLNGIDISMFPAGNYFVRITKEDKSVIKKFILK